MVRGMGGQPLDEELIAMLAEQIEMGQDQEMVLEQVAASTLLYHQSASPSPSRLVSHNLSLSASANPILFTDTTCETTPIETVLQVYKLGQTHTQPVACPHRFKDGHQFMNT